jgi:Coenzyme PQQ synthesis protein D (PqqD)
VIDGISLDSTVVVTGEQVSCDLAGEVIILGLRDGVYYGLDAVGARVWAALQERHTIAEIRDQILREYEVDPERCERDLVALIADLVRHSLVRLCDATAS